jgi:hypothetical protein
MDSHLVTLSASLSLSSIGLADRGALRKAGEFCRATLLGDLAFWGGVSLDHGVKFAGLFVIRLDLVSVL